MTFIKNIQKIPYFKAFALICSIASTHPVISSSIMTQDNPLTIDDATDIAFQNRRDLESFIYAKQASKNNERAAWSGYLPQLNISLSSGKTKSIIFPTTGTIAQQEETEQKTDPCNEDSIYSVSPVRQFSLELSQLLFTLNGPIDKFKIAEQETYIVDAQTKQTEDAVRFGSESSFLEVQKTLLKEKTIQTLKQSSETTFAQRKGFDIVGFLNKSEFAAAQAAYDQEQTTVVNYPSDIGIATSILERQINTAVDPKNISLHIADVTDIILKSIDYYLIKAMENRSELKEKYHQIKQAEYTEKFYKKSYIPECRAYAQVSKSKYAPNNKPLTWNAGVRLDWRFDGLYNFHKGQQFEETEVQLVLLRKDLELKIHQDVKQVYFQLTTFLNQLQASQAAYNQAEEELSRKSLQYKVGEVPRAEYDQALFNKEQTYHTLLSLKIDIKSFYQRLLFLCGYPHEDS